MRTLTIALIGAAVVALMGCGSSSPVAPTGQDLAGSFDNNVSLDPNGQLTSIAGAFHFDLDVAAGTAKVSKLAPRSGAAIGDLFFLNTDNFGFVVAPAATNTFSNLDLLNNTIDFNYQVSHGFPTPSNPGGTQNASTNRADLSLSGRVVFLVDAPATVDDASMANHVDDYSFVFGADTVTCNPKAILNANGFYNPAGMLTGFHTATNNTNAWPFRALVDEGTNNGGRTATVGGAAISNGGSSLGNYAATTSWSTIATWTGGPNVTGYGVLHHGQTAANFITINIAPGNTVSLDALVIATYTDPRGGANAAEKRSNRLPKDDIAKYAYRAPHCSVDLEQMTIGNVSGPLGAAAASTATCDVSVVDYDFATAVGTAITEIPNASGISAIEMSAGELGAQAAVVAVPTGTGATETPVSYAGVVITNTDGAAGGVDAGAYVAVRCTDEQDAATAGPAGAGVTLTNDFPTPLPVVAGQEQHPIVTQVVFVDIV